MVKIAQVHRKKGGAVEKTNAAIAKKPMTHPPFSVMIVDALSSLSKNKHKIFGGAVKTYILSNYDLPKHSINTSVKKAFKRLAELHLVKCDTEKFGLNGHYALNKQAIEKEKTLAHLLKSKKESGEGESDSDVEETPKVKKSAATKAKASKSKETVSKVSKGKKKDGKATAVSGPEKITKKGRAANIKKAESTVHVDPRSPVARKVGKPATKATNKSKPMKARK